MAHFPFRPLLAIIASLICQLMAQFSVYSYVGYAVKHLGIVSDPNKAGYYTGILISSFTIGSIVMSYFWGWFADRYGRRKVVLFGLSSTVTLSIAFGCSRTFRWALLCRFFLGASDGMLLIAKVLISDICGKEHETIGMGVISTAWSIGVVTGTGLGGILVEPATHFPSFFSESGLFGRFPFLLPNVVISGLGLVALPLVLLFIPGHKKTTDVINSSIDGHQYEEAQDNRMAVEAVTQSEHGAHSSELLHEATSQATIGPDGGLTPHLRSKAPGIFFEHSHGRVHLLNFGIYSLVYTSFDAVLYLWVLSANDNGGLDWTTQRIGQIVLLTGFLVFLFELVTVPCITTYIGIKWYQRLGSLFEVPVYVVFPMLARLTDTNFQNVASGLLLFTIYASSNSFCTAISLAINNSTDILHRGEANGLAMTISCIAKTIGPIIFSALFAFSIDREYPFPLDFHLVWYIIAIMRSFTGFLAWNTINDGQKYVGVTADALERVKLDNISNGSTPGDYESIGEVVNTAIIWLDDSAEGKKEKTKSVPCIRLEYNKASQSPKAKFLTN